MKSMMIIIRIYIKKKNIEKSRSSPKGERSFLWKDNREYYLKEDFIQRDMNDRNGKDLEKEENGTSSFLKVDAFHRQVPEK